MEEVELTNSDQRDERVSESLAQPEPGISRGKGPQKQRAPWRAVAIPTEHGGWGLTLEPVLLGMLIAPSWAGLALGTAAFLGFLLRTPLKLFIIDHRRRHVSQRTGLALRVVTVELAMVIGLVVVALRTASAPFWPPLVIGIPLMCVGFWFDVRSRSRRLIPELVGPIAIAAVAPMCVLADGKADALAAALWLVLIGRIFTSVPNVRNQIARLHGHQPDRRVGIVGDVMAVACAFSAAALNPQVALGGLAVGLIVLVQYRLRRQTPSRAAIVGIQQMVLGIAVVLSTVLGYYLTNG